MNDNKINRTSPPWLAVKLLKLFLRRELKNYRLNEFEEIFAHIDKTESTFSAKIWYWKHTLKSIPNLIYNSIYWGIILFRNHFLITFRNLASQRLYSIINISGLAIGIACCLMIFLWVNNELNHNTNHKNIDNIYALHRWALFDGERSHGTGIPPLLPPSLKERYPEVKDQVRFYNGIPNLLVRYNEKKFFENITISDPSQFSIFTIPFIAGGDVNSLVKPDAIVLSEKTAEKYFENEDPVGKVLSVDNNQDFVVAGVVEDFPINTDIKFDVWINLEYMRIWRGKNYLDSWSNLSFHSYILLNEYASLEEFNAKIKNIVTNENPRSNIEPFLYPFKDIYLEFSNHGESVKIFSIVAVFILIIACINYLNLTTARSAKRSREVGLRKVVGANRSQLLNQFFSESFILVIISTAISLMIVLIVLPFFNELTGKEITYNSLFGNEFIIGILLVIVFTGLISGVYPAVYLSSFKPVEALKAISNTGKRGKLFRRVLVITQFSISILLIVCTAVIFNQVEYLLNKNLGYNKEHIISVPVQGDIKNKIDLVKNDLLTNPQIMGASVVHRPLKGIYHNGTGIKWEGKDPNVDPFVTYLYTDTELVDLLDMRLSMGRFFSQERTADQSAVVINESFAKIIGVENVLDNSLNMNGSNYTIIGVVKDFHYKPVTRSIGPLVMLNKKISDYRCMYIKLLPILLDKSIEHVKNVFESYNPEYPFDYKFLDDELASSYLAEQKEDKIIRLFALLAIIISCLGLFGLASFLAEQRQREIGIRKTLGASVFQMVFLVAKEFLWWVIIANVIAIPPAYYIMSRWLEDYIYRIPLSVGLFALAGLSAIIIAILTVSSQAFKAASTDPTKVLKYE